MEGKSYTRKPLDLGNKVKKTAVFGGYRVARLVSKLIEKMKESFSSALEAKTGASHEETKRAAVEAVIAAGDNRAKQIEGEIAALRKERKKYSKGSSSYLLKSNDILLLRHRQNVLRTRPNRIMVLRAYLYIMKLNYEKHKAKLDEEWRRDSLQMKIDKHLSDIAAKTQTQKQAEQELEKANLEFKRFCIDNAADIKRFGLLSDQPYVEQPEAAVKSL